jgi:hypothetical protein
MVSVRGALSWGYHQVADRVVNTGSAAKQTYNTALTAVQAVFNSAAYLASLGMNTPARDISRFNAAQLNWGLSNTYLSILGIINPNAIDTAEDLYDLPPNTRKTADKGTVERYPLSPTRITISDTPVALRSLAFKQQTLMNTLNQSNFFIRHVAARLAAPVTAVALIVYAAVRMVFGALAAIGSAVLCGSNTKLNQFAWHNLGNTGFILNQLQNGILGIVRPELV